MTLKALLNPARKPAPGQADDAPGLAAARVGLARFPAQSLRPGGHAAARGRGLVGAVRRRAVPGRSSGHGRAAAARPRQDAAFFLGSDSLGRDVAAGLAHGARVSLAVGAAAAGISLGIGVLVGAAAGYFGGWLDDVLVRLTELVQTIPTFLLVIVIVAIGQPSARMIVLAIGAASWPVIARLVRAEFRALREAEFVQAARSQGFGDAWIIFREILPNALPPVVVTSSVLVATAILMESALSFLGMGDPNVVSWGSMIGEGREHLRTAWYLAAAPGVAIILTVLSLNLVGDGINDAFNPRLRGRA